MITKKRTHDGIEWEALWLPFFVLSNIVDFPPYLKYNL